jgi:hypothetical protein
MTFGTVLWLLSLAYASEGTATFYNPPYTRECIYILFSPLRTRIVTNNLKKKKSIKTENSFYFFFFFNDKGI